MNTHESNVEGKSMIIHNCKKIEDFDWALGLNRLTLRLMGVWPGDQLHGQPLTVHLRVPIMITSMICCLFLPQMYALTLVIHELPLVVDNLMTSCASFTSCIKLYFMWRSRKIESMRQDWTRLKRDWEFEVMRREAFRARIFTISGYVIVAGAYSGFAFAPLFGFNIRMITNITDYGDHYLMVQSYFPYDYSENLKFHLTLAMQLMAGLFIAMSVSIPDNYFGALVFHASAQFQILGCKIQNFANDIDWQTKVSENKIHKKFQIFFNRHVHLLSNIAALEKSFCFVIAAQVLSMSIMMVCFGFQILGLFSSSSAKPSLLQVLTLLSSLCNLLVHTFVDCLAGEILATRSAGIFHNVYNSKWYMVYNQYTRDIIPMMVAAKIPKPLTAGKIFRLSLQSYCGVCGLINFFLDPLVESAKFRHCFRWRKKNIYPLSPIFVTHVARWLLGSYRYCK